MCKNKVTGKWACKLNYECVRQDYVCLKRNDNTVWCNIFQHLQACSKDEGNANVITILSEAVRNNDLDKKWMAFRQMSNNELCETQWIK